MINLEKTTPEETKIQKDLYYKFSFDKTSNKVLTFFHLHLREDGKYIGYQITADMSQNKIISLKQISIRVIRGILFDVRNQYHKAEQSEWESVRALCLNV